MDFHAWWLIRRGLAQGCAFWGFPWYCSSFWRSDTPKPQFLGAWIGVFKRNWQNVAYGQLSVLCSLTVQLCVNCYCLWLLIAVAKWNEMKVCCGDDIRIRTRSFVEDGGTELKWYYVAGSTSVYIYIIVVAAVIIVVLVVVILLLLKRHRSGSGILQYFVIYLRKIWKYDLCKLLNFYFVAGSGWEWISNRIYTNADFSEEYDSA